jgi:hypothetical protein
VRGLAAVAAGLVLLVACTSSDDDGGTAARDEQAPNPGALPTLAGGLDLEEVDPVRFLVGDGLAYGAPLPSEQAAAEGFLVDPEVREVLVRRVHSLTSGRFVADVLLLRLDGDELFDVGVLDAFVEGLVATLGGAAPRDVVVGDRTTLRSQGPDGAAQGFREGDLVVLVRAPVVEDAALVVNRQLAAAAAGTRGSLDPVTPLVGLPVDAAFVPVPTVAFEPFGSPEEEPVPAAPILIGGTSLQGRYGVVAGERRTVVWAFTLDPATYPSAEVLQPALGSLASTRAGGAPPTLVEVGGRVVQVAVGGPEQLSATAFRHEGLALLVEGTDPAQVDAAVTAWIAAL